MENSSSNVHPAFGYVAAFFIWAAAFVVGNIAGRIAASLQGWDDFSYDRPGAVIYAALQGGLGAYFALMASKAWLGDSRYARFWLAAFVWLIAGLLAAGLILTVYNGSLALLSWSTLSTIVGVIVTEFVRRISDEELA